MEPLAVQVLAVYSLVNFTPNQSVAVFGRKPVCLLCMVVAKVLGGARVIAIDVQKSRLESAKAYFRGGAEVYAYIPVARQGSETSAEYSMRNGTIMRKVLGIGDQRSKSVDLVVEASRSAETCIQTSFYVARTKGYVIQFGIGAFFVTLDLSMVWLKELVFGGPFRYGHSDYVLAIALASQVAGEKGLVKIAISGPGVEVDEIWRDEDGDLI
ncbi:hypothetical protein AAF712_000001 [Marasmius tenuissimus]|uniref:Alcohol dehydrogenase-like C-terminal domain-containing protein n=1 Tax=Marasmius tenuissimus TaxID=585030 RepID=A0ABR3AFS6_9AGAR